MFDLSPAVTGILLLFLGIAFTLLTLGIARLLPRLQPTTSKPSPPTSAQLAAHHEAVLLVQSGGHLVYMNQAARELFNVWETEPNLESLARRARPSQSFLMLCAAEGQAGFSLNGQFVVGSSYYTPGGIGNDPEYNSTILVSLRQPQVVSGKNSGPTWDTGADPSLTPGTKAGPTPTTNQTEAGGFYDSEAHIAEVPSQAFGIFFELTQSMAASLDLDTTLVSVLESAERLFPSDFSEVTLWDPEMKHLIPYRLVGLAGIDRRLETAPERYHADQGYSGYLITHRQALLVKDVNILRSVRPALARQWYPFQSYIGAPLLLAGELIGTLELASLAKENYTESDLNALRLLAGQAVVAINNALLYQKEQQRSAEMQGLANLARSTSADRNSQELYTHLIENISRLVEVDILGFLIYDENRRVLAGQTPFIGLPPGILEWCQASIPPDSPAEAVWKAGETIVTTDAPADERIQAFGLHHLALAAGIRSTVLMPLTASGHLLGYLQAANKRDGTAFNASDLRFLSIIAGQAAPMIENLALVEKSRRRAQRAETLRRIASLTSSAATIEEILKFSVLDLARLLQVDTAAIFLVDETRGEMRLHRGSMFGILPDVSNALGHIPTEGPRFAQTVTANKQLYFSGELNQHDPTGNGLGGQQGSEQPAGGGQQQAVAIYDPLIDQLQIQSIIIAPLIVREQGIGELFIGSFRANFFSSGDAQTVSTACGQIAGAIDRAALFTQTDNNLRQRIDQLVALTRVSRELNTTVKLEDLLQRVYSEALRATRADCGSILLFDLDTAHQARSLSLPIISGPLTGNAQATGVITFDEEPAILFHLGDETGGELHPLERKVLLQGEPLIIDDFILPASETQISKTGNAESRQAGQPAPEQSFVHSGVRSALIVPIAYQGQVAGLIHLHSRSPHHFDSAEREICEALAIQAAIALGNARRFQEQRKRSQELNQRVETLSKIFDVAQAMQSEQPLEQTLELIAYAIRTATPFERILISLYDPEQNHLVRKVGAGIPEREMAELRAHPAPWNSIQMLLGERFSLGRSYFIPAEYADVVPEDVLTYPPRSGDLAPAGGSPEDGIILQGNRWHTDDLWIMPLIGTGSEPLGLLSVDEPRNNLRPDRPTIEAVEIFGSQAALILENQIKIQDMRAQIVKIEAELALAEQTAVEAQSHLPVLMAKDLEQTLAIQNLEQRARRIYAGLEIIEIISQKGSRREVLQSLGQETLGRMGFDTVLIAETSAGGMDLAYTMGAIPEGVNPKALLGQRNPLRQCLQTGESLMIAKLGEDEDWQNTAFLRALEAGSILCLPIPGAVQSTSRRAEKGNVPGNSPQHAAMLAIGRNPVASFNSHDQLLFDLLIRQVTITLQNLSLLDETTRRLKEVDLLMDFSRQLGSLDPASITNSLVESALHAVPAAQTAMVALWDARQGVLVPQASAGYVDAQELSFVRYRPGDGLAGQAFEQKRAINLEEADFSRHYNLSAESLLHFRNATGGRFPVSALAAPILAGSPDTRSTLDYGSDRQIRVSPLGVLVLTNAQAASAFSKEDLVLVSSMAQQAALALENAQLLKETLSLTDDLEIRVQERTIEVARERQRAETLLRIITELSASLDLEQVLKRTLQVLGEFVDAAQITILVTRPGEKKLKRLASIGYTSAPDGSNEDTPFDVDQGLAGWVISQRQSALIGDVLQDERWVQISYPDDTTPKPAFQHRSVMGVQLTSGAEALGCLLLFHPEVDHFSTDHLNLVQAAANQVAVAVNNAELYRLIRDQAEDLGKMLRIQQIEASRSRAILEAVADGVLVTDANRRITLFNEQAELILGLERKDVLGNTMEHFSGLFGPAAQRWMEAIETWSRHPGSLQSVELFSEQITLEDGRVISVHLSPVSLRNEFMGTVSIFQDITHQVEVDRLKSEFVTTVSHELRTPMTSIKGYVDVLLMGAAGPLTEQQSRFLQVVKVHTERLGVLVNDLLDISQIESGRATLAVQPVNLDDIAGQAIFELERRIEGSDKGVKVEKEAQPNLPRVLADPDRVRRVLDNLLDNAFQYNLPGGRILLRLNRVGEEVQVDVRDSGVGIPAEDQERVFERFFRGESTLSLGVAGTGLGLSIVQHLVQLQNGRIWLESTGNPGEGSTFSFTLPVYIPGNSTLNSPGSSRGSSRSGSRGDSSDERPVQQPDMPAAERVGSDKENI